MMAWGLLIIGFTVLSIPLWLEIILKLLEKQQG